MSQRPRLAMLGSGAMAAHHVPAFKSVGFHVVGVAGSLNSRRVETFATSHGIPHVFRDPWELVASDSWDALCVAIPVAETWPFVEKALASNRWVLAEKPTFMSSIHGHAIGVSVDKLVVGFNRRFYPNIEPVRRFISDGAPCMATVDIPEIVEETSLGVNYTSVLENSVHVIDLVRYLFGEVVILGANGPACPEPMPLSMQVRSLRGDLINLNFSWNAPKNFGIDIVRDQARVQLSPIETLRRFEGMQVNEPSQNSPIRSYLPRVIAQVDAMDSIMNLKPGFLGQASEFFELTLGRPHHPQRLARAIDAVRALEIAEHAVMVSRDGK